MDQRNDDSTDQQPPPKPGLLQLVASVLAAAFGVQSRKNRERDFTQGKARAFIVAGIVFTVVFVAVVYGVVSVVLDRAGH